MSGISGDYETASGRPEVLFSVITPVRNAVAKIEATVESVLAQQGVAFEYLVMDGGSTDGTLEILQARTPHIQLFSEADAGIYDAMNKGIRRARGKFLYFLGAGDRLRPSVLEMVAARLPPDVLSARDQPCDFVYGDVNWPAEGGRYGGLFDAKRLAWHNINHQGIFYGRGIFDLFGEYDLRYRLCADFALNIRCFAHPDVCKIHLDLIVADFEDGGASMTRDRAFYADMPGLMWKAFGPAIGLRAWYYNADILRGWHGVLYHLRKPWRTLPARIFRIVRRRLRRGDVAADGSNSC